MKMKRRTLIAYTLIVAAFAPFTLAQAKSRVILIGGIGSTTSQMNSWLADARKKLPGYDVDAVAVSPGSAFEKRVVDEIKDNPDRKYVIAGHSEGASSITRIASRLDILAAEEKIKPENIRVIKLEGYAFAPKYIPYECWYGEGKNGKIGFNGSKMKKCQGSHVRRSCNKTCTTEVCLHFSVVNSTPPPRLGSGELANGYANVSANVSWVAEGAGLAPCR